MLAVIGSQSRVSKSHSSIWQSKVQTQDFWTPTHTLYYPPRLPLGFCKLHTYLHASRFPWLTWHSIPSPSQACLPRALGFFFHSWACPSLPYSICINFYRCRSVHLSKIFFLSYNPCNSIPRCTSTQRMCTCLHQKACPGIFIAAPLIITPNQKLPVGVD